MDNNAQCDTIDYDGQQSDVVSPSMKIVGLERPFKHYAHFEWKKAKKVTPENKSGGAVSQRGVPNSRRLESRSLQQVLGKKVMLGHSLTPSF